MSQLWEKCRQCIYCFLFISSDFKKYILKCTYITLTEIPYLVWRDIDCVGNIVFDWILRIIMFLYDLATFSLVARLKTCLLWFLQFWFSLYFFKYKDYQFWRLHSHYVLYFCYVYRCKWRMGNVDIII